MESVKLIEDLAGCKPPYGVKTSLVLPFMSEEKRNAYLKKMERVERIPEDVVDCIGDITYFSDCIEEIHEDEPCILEREALMRDGFKYIYELLLGVSNKYGLSMPKRKRNAYLKKIGGAESIPEGVKDYMTQVLRFSNKMDRIYKTKRNILKREQIAREGFKHIYKLSLELSNEYGL